ncbi:type III secretion system chaperone [Marivita sp. GX14005]|uniref:type III secretion system chaperone n=1 Tax=Marivita sp. GX14005 TaxID=2942276 RepID=UPI00201A1B24|nr:type III secretion system chaperone [Marivita sp. GX14005]MCL3883317.1 type III secretion system chaperone [Marivita sp. GX14005]
MNSRDAIRYACDALDQAGSATSGGVDLDAGVPLRLTALDTGAIRLEARIAEGVDAAVARRLLEATLNGCETGAAHMALTEQGEAILTRAIHLDRLGETALDAALRDFVAHAAYWTTGPGRDALDSGQAEAPFMPGADNDIILRA